ncbi:methionine/alanine import family NSS transporter small subunit [Isoptericola sp. S6320L]|uniref:methionine/alanine import family NSS transporter small subunit n=1 Tax=Isoptericola sp. S6320L TaxID=2926411 RepID=UPI001FF5389B|nr:methionine/alanine import family NSS transporter small subunit [Isoptericola sp. S6320L]MCK0118452.1 methionine/alanine import family NSS transporter small subunit [Isoptericola sp. S6320L]
MTTEAILMMAVAMIIIWGGLIVSIVALRARPERDDLPPGGLDDHRQDAGIIEHDT